MMTTKREVVEKMCGGKGHVIIDRILGEKELNGKCGLYAKVTIEPGCSLGYHEQDRKSTRLNSSHTDSYRMPSSA